MKWRRGVSLAGIYIKIPASPENDQLANTFHNAGIEDLTNGEIFRSSQPAIIEANGTELLVGKAFLNSVTHTDKPQEYEYSFFGNNADWIIDLKEATFFEFLKHITFTFSKANIQASWLYDGTSEDLPYVFAPVRYGLPMGGFLRGQDGEREPIDNNMLPTYMKPSISIYWLIYWGFKSLGYKVKSDFFNTPYFRKMVMPWVWGSFLSSEGTKYDIHKFRAKSVGGFYREGTQDIVWDLNVVNDTTEGMFDNNNTVVNGDYTYSIPQKEMRWQYNTPHYGNLEVTFSNQTFVDATATANSDVELQIRWYKNGVEQFRETLVSLNAPVIGRRDDVGVKESFFTTIVAPNDVVSAKFYLHIFDTKVGRGNISANVMQFQIDYFKIPLGGQISFDAYLGFKKIKFLELLKGITDCFNLSWQTDPVTKTVFIEPTHPYSLNNDLSTKAGGYFNSDFIDWNDKQDLSKESEMELYKDYEREVLMRFKEDNNDGVVKILQDRNQIKIAASKYIFPERFKSGKKEIENRFFSAVAHYDVEQWKSITGTAPQMVALVPENISNTSASEAENTFTPKICYYKGVVNGMGWIFDGVKDATGNWISGVQNTFPYMFAVNYKNGGDNDPILSYSDEKIGTDLGKGLFKRYYWQRFAIMRNGQWYTTWFKLNNYDVANALHREHKSLKGQKWELVKIENYKPLSEISNKCFLRKWSPISTKDLEATYPSSSSVLNDVVIANDIFDFKYAPLKCLSTDITK